MLNNQFNPPTHGAQTAHKTIHTEFTQEDRMGITTPESTLGPLVRAQPLIYLLGEGDGGVLWLLGTCIENRRVLIFTQIISWIYMFLIWSLTLLHIFL